jgi:hypothetical protein
MTSQNIDLSSLDALYVQLQQVTIYVSYERVCYVVLRT